MNFLNNLSIRNKLLLISLLPLAALLYFVIESTEEDLSTRKNLQNVYNDVLRIQKTSDVLHQILQERGYSITYLVSRGTEERGELFSQRRETDRAIASLGEVLKSQGRNENLAPLNELTQIRGAINTLNTNADTVASNLLRINDYLITEVTRLLNRSAEPEVSQLIKTHLFLSYGKVFLGEIRTRVYLAMLTGGFQNHEFAQFAYLRGKFDVNIERFHSDAAGELMDEINLLQAASTTQRTQALLDSIYSNQNYLSSFSTDEWRESVSSYLQSLKRLEDLSAENILAVAATKLDDTNQLLLGNLLVASLVVFGIIILVFYTIRGIVSSVTKINEAADHISKGDVNLTIAVNAKDEIGMLAGSFNQLIQITKEYSQAAEVIGQGNYSAGVKIRSEDDTLGIALNNMKENLQKLASENEARTWLLTGSSEMNDKMRGEKEVRELAREVIGKIAQYLQAQIGAIYIRENGHLSLAGSYAYQHTEDRDTAFLPGQGLVGQAALEKKPIVFREVPDDYIKISSGLGYSSPRNIVVYPFLYEDEVKGVIEIGMVSEFSELDLQFLNLVAENIGIAFHSSQSRTQLKELLEETQRQTEELEAQQEELRQINEELQEKTKLLESSEAELKAQQEELQQTNEELEEKANLLEQQKDELENSKLEVETKARELEITSKYKSEFLANMSHELRTPLNSILILAQILSENKSHVLGEKEVNFARNIYGSGTDLLNLINEILDLSKIESGKIELEISQIPIPGLLTDISAMFEEVARNKDIGFEINYKEEDFKQPFSSDEQKLEQILRNLLSNAFKFTGHGGSVRLTVEKAREKGRRRGPAAKQDMIAFTVVDTGVGIPSNKLNVVFEAFQQADGSTKRKYGGTGLGLSISRELAHALGGEISVKSEEGKGSTFTLFLPLEFTESRIIAGEKEVTVRNTAPAIVEEPKPQPTDEFEVHDDRFGIGENDKVILIIEDDTKLAGVLLEFIQTKGYKGILAHQGNTGLSLARHYQPDAIILDMKLPVMNGSEVLRHLKNDPSLRHIPVQLISGDDYRKQGVELGAFDFLKKPFNKNELNSAFGRIEEFVNRRLKRLLVVEDDKTQNIAIKELVGNGDVKSTSAYTGIEAYEMMQKEKFDCVIIDLGLPDMTGFDLMEKIKANEKLHKTPVIVYTGKDLSKTEAMQLSKLANTVVLKTVDSHERLLDETILFLHRVESRLPKDKQQIIRSLHKTEEVLKNKKVLIVDDDMRNIFSLTNALEEEGVKCITAENGKAALASLNDHTDTDIVLMDIMMPEMDGYEATREIRKQNKFNQLPIIALTAKAMKGDREKCLEAGMSDYITKPVNIEQLLSLMRVWLYK